MQTPKTVRIYTRLLDHGHECARLWTLLRALDVQGSGWVSFDYAEIARLMGVSVRTIQRWVRQGLERGWFRGRRWMGDQVELYLSGIKAVKHVLGVDGLGAIADVSPKYLGRSEAKALCTALEAQHRQNQAYWAAKNARKGRAKQLVLDPEKMATCEEVSRVKSLVIVSEPFCIPGCAIAGLAKATDWSQSTIKRRLSNRWRCDRNLDILQKKRVAHELDDPGLLFELRESGQSFLVTENALGHTRVLKVLTDSGRSKVLSLGCNIYSTGHELLSCRNTRRRVKAVGHFNKAQVCH